MTNADRERAIDRIRKLRRMTVANGCTEAEALLALQRIAELIATYDLTDSEVNLRQDRGSCTKGLYSELRSTHADWTLVCASIAKLFHCRAYQEFVFEDVFGLGTKEKILQVVFFGYPQDVEACEAMTEICYTAINTESGKLKRPRKLILQSFRQGMIQRLRERIKDMAIAQAPVSGSTALIVLKDQLVTEEFAKLNMRFRKTHTSTMSVDESAYAAGQAAADRVNLGNRAYVGATKRLTADC